MYGLKHKESGNLIKFFTTSNRGGDFCVDYSYNLVEDNDNGDLGSLWLVNDPLIAEYVRNFSTKWYNAGMESPYHNFKPEELEVVKVVIETSTIEVKIPTVEELLISKYGKGGRYEDLNTLNWCLKGIKSGSIESSYDLYELLEYKEEMERKERDGN